MARLRSGEQRFQCFGNEFSLPVFLVVVSLLISFQVLLFSGTTVFVYSIPTAEKHHDFLQFECCLFSFSLCVYCAFTFCNNLLFCVWFCFICCYHSNNIDIICHFIKL